jgi:hypothetical protein
VLIILLSININIFIILELKELEAEKLENLKTNFVNDSQVTSVVAGIGQIWFVVKNFTWWSLGCSIVYLILGIVNFLYNISACWKSFTTPTRRKWKAWLALSLGVVGASCIFIIEVFGGLINIFIMNHLTAKRFGRFGFDSLNYSLNGSFN